MDADEVRLECLRLAQQIEAQHRPGEAEDVVKRARCYAAFVIGSKVETSEAEDVKAT